MMHIVNNMMKFSKIKFIFNYEMPYLNVGEMVDSIDSKSKPLHSINISTNDIDKEVNDSRLIILVTNIINIEYYDI